MFMSIVSIFYSHSFLYRVARLVLTQLAVLMSYPWLALHCFHKIAAIIQFNFCLETDKQPFLQFIVFRSLCISGFGEINA